MTTIGYTSYADWRNRQQPDCCCRDSKINFYTTLGVVAAALPAILSNQTNRENVVKQQPETPANNTANTETPIQEPPKEMTPEQFIEKALQDNTSKQLYKEDKIFQQQILDRYNLLKNSGLSPELIEKKIQNFAKGYEIFQFENTAEIELDNILKEVEGTNLGEDNTVAYNVTDLNAWATNYIEYFDTNNDGQIHKDEMLEKMVEDYYYTIGKTSEEIKNIILDIKNDPIASWCLKTLDEKFRVLEFNLADGESEMSNDKLNNKDILQYYMYQSNAYKDDSVNSITQREYAKFYYEMVYGDPTSIMSHSWGLE